jgi:hypothetical protein
MKKIWEWVRAHWKLVLGILVAAAGALVVTRIVGELRALLTFQVDREDKFRILDATHVAVQTPEGWKSIDVGAIDMRADQVKAVEVIPGGTVKVERRNTSIDDLGGFRP